MTVGETALNMRLQLGVAAFYGSATDLVLNGEEELHAMSIDRIRCRDTTRFV